MTATESVTPQRSFLNLHVIAAALCAIALGAYAFADLPLTVHDALGWAIPLVALIGGVHALYSLFAKKTPGRATWGAVVLLWIVLATFPAWLFALGFALGGAG